MKWPHKSSTKSSLDSSTVNPREAFDALNQTDETHNLEAKTAGEAAGVAIYKSICAFANADGGHILCGVTRKRNLYDFYYEVSGVKDTDKLQCDIQSAISTKFNRPVQLQFSVDCIDARNVLLIRVTAASPQPCQVYFADLFFPRGVFQRRGAVDHQCTDDDVPQLLEEQAGRSFDETIVDDASPHDLDRNVIAIYRKKRAELDECSDEIGLIESDFLIGQNCLKEKSGKYLPTVSGILLFGTRLAVKRIFPNSRIEYCRIPGVIYRSDPGQRSGDLSKTLEGPLIETVNRAKAQVIDDFPMLHVYQPGTLTRTEQSTVEERVVREIIVNAVTHRCYRDSGPISVTRYANRLMVMNPGNSLVPISHLGVIQSRCRNPKLARSFRDIKWAEYRGTGIGTLRAKMEEGGFPEPVFDNDPIGQTFQAILVFTRFDEQSVSGWIEKAVGKELDLVSLKVMFFAREIGAVNCSIVQSIEFIDELAASEILGELSSAGLLEAKGSRSTRRFVLTEHSRKTLHDVTSSANSDAGGSNHEAKATNSEAVDANSEPAAVIKVFVGDDNVVDEDNELPEELAQLLNRIGSRTSDKELMRKAVLALCEWQPQKLTDLAVHLKRKSTSGLYRDYVAPMTIDKLLELRYANAASHPNQMYVITETGSQWLLVNSDL